jgi:hypothetical protein
MRTRAHGYAVHAEKTQLAPFTFERRDLRPNDVGHGRSEIIADRDLQATTGFDDGEDGCDAWTGL